jgi:hypothetical protein
VTKTSPIQWDEEVPLACTWIAESKG